MNGLIKILPLATLFTMASVGIRAEVVYQLAAVDTSGVTVVIEYATDHWEVVFEGSLDDCSVPAPDDSGHDIPNTFHQPLGNGQFAFACSNGNVYIAENDKPAEVVVLPTRNWSWIENVKPYLNENSKVGVHFDAWRERPVYMAYSNSLNNASGNNELFVAQKNHLFLIDINTRQLAYKQGWHFYFGQPYLSVRTNDSAEWSFTGLKLSADHQGEPLLLGAFAREDHEGTAEPDRMIQRLSLTGDNPVWERLSQPDSQSQQNLNLSTPDRFSCAAGLASGRKIQHIAPAICNWPTQLAPPPAPKELQDVSIKPQRGHYQSYITFTRTPDNDDVRRRTSPNAFGRKNFDKNEL